MSVTQRLVKAGFVERDPQQDRYVGFWVPGGGASIYVHVSGTHFHVPTSPLRLGKFPNNQQVREFVQAHGHHPRKGNREYRLDCDQIDDFIAIVRDGS